MVNGDRRPCRVRVGSGQYKDAIFHGFFQGGDKGHPLAVVEYSDGRVDSVLARHVTFLDKAKIDAEPDDGVWL